MKLAYFDCFSGISGDMILGAMVALGVPLDWFRQELTRIPLAELNLKTNRVSRHGIQATQIDVIIQETHHHRTYHTIRELIDNSHLSNWVKSKSLAVFDRIATAEAAIHGVAKDDVHFHEVGAVDAIADIVGACLGFEYLEIETVIASPLPLGKGFVRCQHGTLPVPAPATVEILKGIPVYAGQVELEMVTPTGAAIIAEFASSFEPIPQIRIDAIGYGAGTREIEQQPNLLRVLLGSTVEQIADGASEALVMVESNIDDMNPELYGYLMEKLFADGALDVFWIPVHMKKNRPGTLVQVLCSLDQKSLIVERLLTETTTLGVRFYNVYRKSLVRESVDVESRWGTVKAKKVVGMDGSIRIIPEFEACKQIAVENSVALRIVYETVSESAQKIQTGGSG